LIANFFFTQTGESTALETLKQFFSSIVRIYGAEYLFSPNEDNTKKILAVSKSQGFPGMMGSLD
jgi:hypothetical protein